MYEEFTGKKTVKLFGTNRQSVFVSEDRFLLSKQKEQLGLSDVFFKECQNKIGKSKRYLSRDITDGVYDSQWKLVVPSDLNVKNGVIEDAAI